MNITFKAGEVVNGFKFVGKDNIGQFVMENEDVIISFASTAGEGVNYSKVVAYSDKRTGKHFRAQRYLLKYVSLVQGFSNVLYQRYREANGGL